MSSYYRRRRRNVSKWKRVLKFLNNHSDVTNKFVPLIVIAMGIGLVKFLPAQVTTKLFPSVEAREEFLKKHNVTLDSDLLIIFTNGSCGGCDAIAKGLDEEKIPYRLQNPDESVFWSDLFTKVTDITVDKHLPLVVLGNYIVVPDLESVKIAYRRVKPK